MRPPGSPRTGVPGRLHREAAGERPPRARPQRRGSPGPIPNPAVKPAFAESTAAQGCGRAGRRARGGRFSNMSRTLSIGKVGPGPDFSGSGPFSISTPPAATSACLSDARLRSLISARGASLRWTIRCYGWGYLVETTVCARGWRLRRSQKKRLGFAPTASDQTAGWDVSDAMSV